MITMQKESTKKIGVELNENLRKKYGIRSFPLVKGDVVKIVRGSRKGEGGKVNDVNHITGFVSVDGITIAKSDNKQQSFFLRPEKLVITRLDFSRQDRIERIRKIAAIKKIELSEEDLQPEPEPVEETPQDELSEVPADETGEQSVPEQEETDQVEEPEEQSSEDVVNEAAEEPVTAEEADQVDEPAEPDTEKEEKNNGD